MEKLISFIDKYMLEILITCVILFVLLFLVRSFKRTLLLEKGQARFVLEHYDASTEKMHKWLSLLIFMVLLPLLAYVKYLRNFS